MAKLEVLKFPDPRLKITAQPVIQITDNIKQIVADMFETMYFKKGVGLAATQVGIDLRIFVMDVSENHNEPICVINPEILSQSGEQYEDEGCLSVIGAYDKVPRSTQVHLRGINLESESFELHAKGLMAVCIQHEVDHLNGKLFINRLSRLKYERIKNKIEKYQRRV